MDKSEIKKKIVRIYKKNNPSKLSEVDGLLLKYAGKEDDLLKAIKEKYQAGKESWDDNNFRWKFILKHLPDQRDDDRKDKRQKAIWYVEESIQEIKPRLDEYASLIDGNVDIQYFNDHRVLVVVRDMTKPLCYKSKVESTVGKMRDVIHHRYSHLNRPTDASNEYERRKLEKNRDKNKKAAIDKSRGRKGVGGRRR